MKGARRTQTGRGVRLGPWLLYGLAAAFMVVASPARAGVSRALSVGRAASWVDIVEAEPPTDGADETATDGRRYLLSDRQIRVGRGGSPDETYEHWSEQIVSEPGLQAASQVNVEFDPTFQTVVLHSLTVRRGDQKFDRLDLGSVRVVQREPNLEAQVYDGRQTAIFFVSDLRVGDIIDYAYTVRGSDPTLDGKFAATAVLGVPEPVGRLRVRVSAPRERHIGRSFAGPSDAPALAWMSRLAIGTER